MHLQTFDYVIQYQPGKNNIADPFSRLLKVDWSQNMKNSDYKKNLLMFVHLLAPAALAFKDIQKATEKDEFLSRIIRSINTGSPITEKPFCFITDELSVIDGVLVRGTRLVIPATLHDQVLNLAHKGHPGVVKAKDQLRTKVWWPGIDAEAEKIIKLCKSCQRVGLPPKPTEMSR